MPSCCRFFWCYLCACKCWAAQKSMESVTDGVRSMFPGVKQLSVADLQKWMREQEGVPILLLDVRAREEYETSHIRDAEWAEDLARAEAVLEDARHNELGVRVVCYCSVGMRSSSLASRLTKKHPGLEVYNLEGSLFEWWNRGQHADLCRHADALDDASEEISCDVIHPYSTTWGKLLKRQ
jgi:rhodanese-related sulfurtransferase